MMSLDYSSLMLPMESGSEVGRLFCFCWQPGCSGLPAAGRLHHHTPCIPDQLGDTVNMTGAFDHTEG
jgi:hypothetical protein